MKLILIIRHAKSSWDSPAVKDFDRPLNERGQKDALEMAHRIKKRNIKLDLCVSSPALRAKSTATCFKSELEVPNIELVNELYHASTETIYDCIGNLPSRYHSVALFTHNPGITDFVNTLSPKIKTDNVPTCGIFAVRAAVDEWKDFEKSAKEFLFFDYPKLGD